MNKHHFDINIGLLVVFKHSIRNVRHSVLCNLKRVSLWTSFNIKLHHRKIKALVLTLAQRFY